MEKRIDVSSDDEEQFYSASSHGDLGTASALLAFQLAFTSAALYHRARSQHRTPGLPSFYPLGLPRLPVKKKRERSRPLHAEVIAESSLQHGYGSPEEITSNDGYLGVTNFISHGSDMEAFSPSGGSHTRGHQQPWNASGREISSLMEASCARTQEQPWNASIMERFCLPERQEKLCISEMENPSSFEDSVPESFHLVRTRTRAASRKDCSSNVFTPNDEDGSVCSLAKVSMDKDLDRMSVKEIQPQRSSLKRDSVHDGEGSICTSDLCLDGETTSFILDHRTLVKSVNNDEDKDEGNLINRRIGRITDLDNPKSKSVTSNDGGLINRGIRRIKDLDYSEESSVSSDNLSQRSSSSLPLPHHEKRQSPSFDYEANEHEDRGLEEQREVDERYHTNIIYGDGSDLKDSRLHRCKELEGSSIYRMPEEGQHDSLLLWPVRMAIEAISFQVRLVAQAFALIALVYNWCNSFASSRVRETLQVKERATEALSQKVAMITNVPPKVTESGSVVLKRAAWGCFAAIYICILLSMLLFPALLLDYVFLSRIVEEPVSIKEPLHFDYTIPHPTAVVSVHPSSGFHSSLGKSGSYQGRTRVIPIAHRVHITVILMLPESDYNRNLGMFQVSAELLSENGQTLKSSSRPCMLRFHSAPIRMLKTFFVSLPSLVGAFTESQTLVVHLMEFEEQHVATKAVWILLQPKAGMPLGQGIPEIYSADVHIESHLPWLKNLMWNWKWTAYIWTGLMLYVVEVVMVLCCCRQALLPKSWMGQTDEVKAEQLGVTAPAELHESGFSQNKLPRKRAPSKYHSLNEHIPTATAVDRREHKLRQGGSHSSI